MDGRLELQQIFKLAQLFSAKNVNRITQEPSTTVHLENLTEYIYSFLVTKQCLVLVITKLLRVQLLQPQPHIQEFQQWLQVTFGIV